LETDKTMPQTIAFTKTALGKIEPAARRVYYRDIKRSHLYLSVMPAGSKTFYAQVTVEGKTVRHRLGKFPALSVQRASTLADKAAGVAASGGDPSADKRRRLSNKMTLEELFDVYLAAKKLKPTTQTDYRRAMHETFGDWLERPAANITEEMVLKRYLKRGKVSEARTDNALRVMRAVFNYGHAAFRRERMFPFNPTDGVLEAKVRYSVGRRRTKIDNADLPAWWAAVHGLPMVYRDWFVFRLLTGTRVTEAAGLQWSDVNLRRKTFLLRDTKTGNDVELPLPEYAAGLLLETKPRNRGRYVFPNANGKPLATFKRPVAAIREATETAFTPYDTRRTFVSLANALNISRYTVKALVNHALGDDVTAGYDVPDMERLREASQSIEAKFLRLAKAIRAEVINIR
jgi:integrase